MALPNNENAEVEINEGGFNLIKGIINDSIQSNFSRQSDRMMTRIMQAQKMQDNESETDESHREALERSKIISANVMESLVRSIDVNVSGSNVLLGDILDQLKIHENLLKQSVNKACCGSDDSLFDRKKNRRGRRPTNRRASTRTGRNPTRSPVNLSKGSNTPHRAPGGALRSASKILGAVAVPLTAGLVLYDNADELKTEGALDPSEQISRGVEGASKVFSRDSSALDRLGGALNVAGAGVGTVVAGGTQIGKRVKESIPLEFFDKLFSGFGLFGTDPSEFDPTTQTKVDPEKVEKRKAELQADAIVSKEKKTKVIEKATGDDEVKLANPDKPLHVALVDKDGKPFDLEALQGGAGGVIGMMGMGGLGVALSRASEARRSDQSTGYGSR